MSVGSFSWCSGKLPKTDCCGGWSGFLSLLLRGPPRLFPLKEQSPTLSLSKAPRMTPSTGHQLHPPPGL